MREIFANRSDWLIHVAELEPLDVVTIHPLDGLTGEMIVKAMAAMKLLQKKPGYTINHHGTKIFVQRMRGNGQ